jgi:hypothetical protein
MAEIWPNLLPHKTFRADASLRQRLDSGHFLCLIIYDSEKLKERGRQIGGKFR